MNRLLITFLLLPSCFYLAQQKKYSDINCEEDLCISYYIISDTTEYITEELKEEPKKNKKFLHEYNILLEEGFNDTLKIYLNGTLIKSGFYTTDPSLGLAGTITFSEKKKNTDLIIFIKSISRNRCIEFSLDRRFRIIAIQLLEDSWWILYSNKFPLYE